MAGGSERSTTYRGEVFEVFEVDSVLIYTTLISYAMNVLLAIVGLIVGLKVIGWITGRLDRQLKRTEVDETLNSFLVPLARVALQVLLVISIASLLGMEMTSFIAVVGAAGLAVGLALQGSLANFAGGVLIMLLRPFEVGDFIEVKGYSGTVAEMQIFYTVLNTPDNRRIIIPNANVSNSSTVNFSKNPTRRVDLDFGVGYESDIDTVKGILMEIAENTGLIMEDPAPQVMLSSMDDSAVVFRLRVWTRREDYWTVYFDTMEIAKRRFDAEGINIPYPQMDVHLNK